MGTDRKSTRLNSSHTEIYTLSLHDALPICGTALVTMAIGLAEIASAQARRASKAYAVRFILNGNRSEEHTSELQSHRDLHSFPTRRSSDLWHGVGNHGDRPCRDRFGAGKKS